LPYQVPVNGMAWVACNRDANKVAITDDPICRVEIDPAGTRQIDLTPGMGGTATDKR